MSNFNLDHIFCFCEPQLVRESEIATEAGFTFNPGNRHPGQGTANRAIIFEENYLELIFIDSFVDAQKNPLRLDKRADWQKTAASPFGICLRGSISENERSEFWDYHPPYWPDGVIFIHKSNEETPEQPLIFVMPSSARPIERPNFNLSHLKHKTDSKAIRNAKISGPDYRWPEISKPAEIVLSKAERHQMKVNVDGVLPNKIFLNDLLSIVGDP